ncbi:MAG: glutathione peroxidase [Bacteriovoracaceae bacterium]|nr:glutathione peroxidase [Bacteriovoracaceae bacterium]
MSPSIYDFEVKTTTGENIKLDSLKGKALLIVNVASQCGFTPQYKGLETLYRKFKDQNFSVLGFPCNQFGAQEPGDDEEIKKFCSLTYDVTFPLFAKIDVNGPKTHPLYQFLKSEEKGILGTEAIKWNFTKFLVSKTGEVLKRYAPTTTPESIEKEIVELL